MALGTCSACAVAASHDQPHAVWKLGLELPCHIDSQARLAHASRTGERDEAVVFPLKQLRNRAAVLVAPDRGRGRRRQSADRSTGRFWRSQARVMGEDRLFELPERWRWLEAEFVDECRPRGPIGLESLGLAAAAIERQHELTTQSLTQRMLCHERLELADELGVPSAGQVSVDAVLEQGESQLLEPADLSLRERVECKLGERGPAPDSQRLAQLHGGPCRGLGSPAPRDPDAQALRSGGGRAGPARAEAGSHSAV